MTRSRERAAAIERAGATATVCDALDAPALLAVVATADPDVVVHQLTALPHRFDPRKKRLYDATNHVRTEGTRNLLEAAGGRRVVCQSIAFAYAPDREPPVFDEDAPLFTEAIGARPPRRAPLWLVRLLAGKAAAGMATTLPGASNARAKAALGGEPRWPSWQTGFSEAPR